MIGTLVDRPIIRKCFDAKLPMLVSMCGQELNEVKLIFDRCSLCMYLHYSMWVPTRNSCPIRIPVCLREDHELYYNTIGPKKVNRAYNHTSIACKDWVMDYRTLCLAVILMEIVTISNPSSSQVSLARSPSGPVLNKNMPRVAGILQWAQQLRDRISGSIQKLRSLDHRWVHITGL